MIISSAPFRISFAGGGSDLPVFCRRHKGAVLSTTIDKHVYISIHPYFHRRQTLLKYSRNELVDRVEEIQHPIFRTALMDLWPQGGLEIVSTADIPAGTGLGSSSTFTVALLHALHAFRGVFSSKEKLAREACQIEIDRLGEPIGRQDQYAAAYGGLNFMEFLPDGGVVVTPLLLRQEIVTALERNLLLFYTGQQRDTRGVLTDQQQQVAASEEKFNNLARMADYAYQMRDQLLAGELAAFARSMHEAWLLKRTLSARIGTADRSVLPAGHGVRRLGRQIARRRRGRVPTGLLRGGQAAAAPQGDVRPRRAARALRLRRLADHPRRRQPRGDGVCQLRQSVEVRVVCNVPL